MPADDAIMANLAKIIDLGSFTDHGVAHSTAVNLGPGANFNIIVNDHAGKLRHFDVPIGARHIAEAVLADVAAGMDIDAVADMRIGVVEMPSTAQSRPMRTRCPITALARINVPAPISAWAPITAPGSTVTSLPNRAEGCTNEPGETPSVPNTESGEARLDKTHCDR